MSNLLQKLVRHPTLLRSQNNLCVISALSFVLAAKLSVLITALIFNTRYLYGIAQTK